MQNICIAGDLNREFIRANYKHTITLHIFIVCKTQCSTLLHDYAEIVCTFSNMSIDFLFTLDHVIVSPMLYDSMFSYYSLCDWFENQSDYCCLISNFFCDVDWCNFYVYAHKPRKQWERANQDKLISYKALLDSLLLTIDML